MTIRKLPPGATYLGIEAGATRTSAKVEIVGERRAIERTFGPANLRLSSDAQLVRHFGSIAAEMPRPGAIAIGMAGARTDADKRRIVDAAERVWPGVPCYPTGDLETALMAAPSLRRGEAVPRVLVLSGTGSCCYGQGATGKTAKVGGWGHILGDKGSGYEIALRALKAMVYYHDRDGEWSELGRRILRALMLNEPNDLIAWVQCAQKHEVAGLAVEVFAAWQKRDRIARDILIGAAHSLANDAVSCARNLTRTGRPVQFVFAGSVLLKQPRFARLVRRQIEAQWSRAHISLLKRSGAEGALELAKRHFPVKALAAAAPGNSAMQSLRRLPAAVDAPPATPELASIARSPTEQRNPRSTNLDQLSIGAAVELMLSEDARIPRALRSERTSIERGISLVVKSFRRGGRLFYVGAGTSGRLGVLDASECPPTFRTDPEMVQGIIAGGQVALWSAVEGAEDDEAAGSRAIGFRGVASKDTVVGIAASGRTPFVWGALIEARRRGASTILVCFNPNLAIARDRRPDVVIAPRIGPEILTGSTRLKSGTATKLILNMFTTLAMVKLGKVRSNLMIDVKASNVKLRDRATRIVRELTGVSYDAAQAALTQCRWRITEACRRLKRARR